MAVSGDSQLTAHPVDAGAIRCEGLSACSRWGLRVLLLLLPLLQSVEAPALAVMVPLLVKGLREATAIQRKSCVIITNMSKLVNSPREASNFLPK